MTAAALQAGREGESYGSFFSVWQESSKERQRNRCVLSKATKRASDHPVINALEA